MNVTNARVCFMAAWLYSGWDDCDHMTFTVEVWSRKLNYLREPEGESWEIGLAEGVSLSSRWCPPIIRGVTLC